MKKIMMPRLSHTHVGTFGTMMYQPSGLYCWVPFCVTLELPWKDNKVNESCIPSGIYSVCQADKDEALEILSVPGRTGIQIEVANSINELEGCIAVGEKFESFYKTTFDIQESRNAFNELIKITGGKFNLEVLPPNNSYLYA